MLAKNPGDEPGFFAFVGLIYVTMLRFTQWLFVVELDLRMNPAYSIPLFEARKDVAWEALREYDREFVKWMRALVQARVFTDPDNECEARALARMPVVVATPEGERECQGPRVTAAQGYSFVNAMQQAAIGPSRMSIGSQDLLDGMQMGIWGVYRKMLDPNLYSGGKATYESKYPGSKEHGGITGTIRSVAALEAAHEARKLAGRVDEKRVAVMSKDDPEKELFRVSTKDANIFVKRGEAVWIKKPTRIQALVDKLEPPGAMPTVVRMGELEKSGERAFDPAAREEGEVELGDMQQHTITTLQRQLADEHASPDAGGKHWQSRVNRLSWALEIARRMFDYRGIKMPEVMRRMHQEVERGQQVNFPTPLPDSWLQRGKLQMQLAQLIRDATDMETESVELALQEFRKWFYIHS